MQNESRIKKSLLNAKVNMFFYILMLAITFFSRKIFLEKLGADFIGLAGTLQNILGFLNLAELGIGAAVSFALYKPIQEGNKNIISSIISVFGYYYRKIGLIILIVAFIISLFIPLMFNHTTFNYGIIYFAFYSFLISSLIGYFVNYRQILLSADQKNYVIAAYFQTANIIRILLQIFIAIKFSNYYLWVAIELIFSLIYAFILNFKINQTYPWLNSSVNKGKIERKDYSYIIIKTKQVFVHKIKDFLLGQSDQILVFAFVSLKMVAYYGNYTLVISRITQLFSVCMDGMAASVGNLVAENDIQKIDKVFWELTVIRYFVGGVIVFSVSQLIEPFISLWIGSQYILDKSVLVLILLNSYIMIVRGTVDMFNNAYGNYGDTWSAWVEAIICLSVTIWAARDWGLIGILLGKIASMVPIIMIWKPIYLYKEGFKTSINSYWKGIVLNILLFIIAFLIVINIKNIISINPYTCFMNWITYAVIITMTFVVLYASMLYVFTNGAKNLVKRVFLKKGN